MTQAIHPHQTIEAILDSCPTATGVLHGLGLDTCCSRRLSLEEACEKNELDVRSVVAALEAAAAAPGLGSVVPQGNGGIDPGMSVRAILAKWPATTEVFRRHGLMDCGGAEGPDEPLGFFAKVHHVPMPVLMDQLRRASLSPPPAIRLAPPPQVPPSAVASEPPRRFVPFFVASLLLTLTLGATLGMINLGRMTAVWGWGTMPRPSVWAHAYAQMFGFVGLFVMGVAYHVMPRFAGVSLRGSALVPWTFWLQVAGVVTIGAALLSPEPIAWLWAAGGVALTAAAILFTSSIAGTLRAAEPSPEPFARWVLAGCAWLVVASVLVMVAGATGDSTWHFVLWPAALLGFAGSWIFGVGRRIFPVFLGWEPRWPGAERSAFVLYQLGVAAWSIGAWPSVGGVLFFVRGTGAVALITAVVLYTVIIGCVPGFLRRNLGGPRPLDRGYEPYIYAAWVWLFVGLLFGPLWTLAALVQGRYGSVIVLDFGRHALALGFVTQMIVGVASRVVPVFTGRALWSPAVRTATFWLLNGAVAIRGLEVVVATGLWPGAWPLIAWSGPPAVAAMLLFTVNIIMTVRSTPQAAAAAGAARAADPADTLVADLLEIPGALEVLVEAGFTPLQNPVMRATFARTVTLRQACRMRGVPIEPVLARLKSLLRPRVPTMGQGPAQVVPLAALRRGTRG